MLVLFVITVTIAIAGIVAMEFGQARRPRGFTVRNDRAPNLTVWNDDIERRLLRLEPGRRNRW